MQLKNKRDLSFLTKTSFKNKLPEHIFQLWRPLTAVERIVPRPLGPDLHLFTAFPSHRGVTVLMLAHRRVQVRMPSIQA